MADRSEIRIIPEQMLNVFNRILISIGFNEEDAMQCAMIFRDNSLDGVYTHGVNRFPRFVEYVQKGFVKPGNKPFMKNQLGNIEQWDGNLGPGPLNAVFATEQALRLARENGIGCVGLSNTNHWMRGGTYGWYAAKQNCMLIAFTNTIANMPAWGAMDKKLGNNPMVIAVPYGDTAIVLDMAMSQFAIGALQQSAMKGETMQVDAGFDTAGNPSRDPEAILKSGRTMPTGYWKGSGLALLLDILAATISGGMSTSGISEKEAEYAVSQVFIAIDYNRLGDDNTVVTTVNSIIEDYKQSIMIEAGTIATYPGERVIRTRNNNLEKGIPVMNEVWKEIMALYKGMNID